MSAWAPDWSLRTPILTTPSEIWACAGPTASATAASSARTRRVIMRGLLSRVCPDAGLDPEVLVQRVHPGRERSVGDHIDDASVLHHVVTVGDRGREAEILLDEEDGEALRLEAPDRRADLLDDHRREAFRGLVQEQQARAGSEDAPDREHLLLAAGQLGALGPEALAQVGEQVEDRPAAEPARADLGRQHEIFLDAEAREDPALLGAERDAEPRDEVRGETDQLGGAEADRAPAPLDDPHHGLERGRLAGAVPAEQRHDLARAHLEIHPVEDVRLAVPGLEVAHGQERLRHRPPPWTPGSRRGSSRRRRRRTRRGSRRAPAR